LRLGLHTGDRISVLLGPEIAYLLRSVVRYPNSEPAASTNSYPRFDAGLSLGLAYKISKFLSAESYYTYGFNTLYYIDGAGVKHDETKGANRTVQLGIAYTFQ
jgi:hypothetical protein